MSSVKYNGMIKHHAVYVSTIAGLIACGWEIFRLFYARLIYGDQYYQNFAFPFLAAYAVSVLQKRRTGDARFGYSAPGMIAGVVCAAAALFAYHGLFKVTTSFYLMTAAASLFAWGAYGGGFMRVTWPAFLFLPLMVPFHTGLLQGVLPAVTLPERLSAAWAAARFAVICGIPAVSNGTDIMMEHFTMKVAVACSGANYIIGMLAVLLLYALLSIGSFKRKLLLFALSPFISLTGNTVRVTANVLVAGIWGNEAALWFFHEISGLVFVGLIISVMLWAGDKLGLKLSLVGKV